MVYSEMTYHVINMTQGYREFFVKWYLNPTPISHPSLNPSFFFVQSFLGGLMKGSGSEWRKITLINNKTS